MRDHVPVVVQGSGRRGRRAGLAGVLWAGAELIVTVGVVVLLLVVHQVWWTNRQAAAAAQEQVQALERAWGEGPAAGGAVGAEVGAGADGGGGGGPVVGPEPSGPTDSGAAPAATRAARPAAPPVAGPSERDRAYAVLRVPRLGLVVPVAQGVDKRAVLDKGYAGQYPGTAGPGAQGNFALAGHRNTHGEPFRYINRLRAGDELIVDMRGRRYTYVVGKILGETTERDTGVIAPVPRSVVKPDQGYSEPGAYITLTTCTPEYTSKYRLVVWGTLLKSS
ncbi:class E sortase [Streptomyces xanthophaeus]|uniref:class E sortase n=1 Tax=Streptomyces xanthophaeus TaxID=67385 RepID=UPI0026479BB1|nr:class E sortase [Streptomyces xanthophaeus]WKD34491.1 class E sortase [Streptomyces xanthophaeus]